MNSSERLRRANALWHAYLAATGQRFELASFLRDAGIEKQTVAQALASGDQKLVGLARDWLRDTGQAVPSVAATQAVPAPVAPEAARPSRYLRGVR